MATTAASRGGEKGRKYWRAQRIRVNGRLVAPLPEEYHGRRSTNDYYGCGCDLCVRAAREYNRDRNRRAASSPAETPRQDDSPGQENHHVDLPAFLEPMPAQRKPQSESQPEPPEPEESETPAEREPIQAKPAPPAHRPRPADLDSAPDLGGEVPTITPGARREITTLDQLKAVVEAYHRPQWTAPIPDDPNVERRAAEGVMIRVALDSGHVVFVGEADRPGGDSHVMRETSVPKSTKRGGGGSNLPTSYEELAKRLADLGCTVDRSGQRITVYLPDGRKRKLPSNPNDWRGLRNAVSQFRAEGFDVRRSS